MRTSFSKIMKKAACVCAAALCSFSLFGTMASCASDTPKAKITLSFNGNEYELNYRLYKKFFPRTVEHFTEVAKSGYYDGLCIHNYYDSAWYTGGYTYEDGKLEARDYYDFMSAKNVSLTQTVFTYSDIMADSFTAPTSDKGLNTVYGEFENNGFTIKNNDKKIGSVKKEGSLVMYYYTNPSDIGMSEYAGKLNVLTKRNTPAATLNGDAKYYNVADYCYNSATSLFYFDMNTSSTIKKDYTVFGEPWEESDSKQLDKLQSDIAAYISNNYDSKNSDFVEDTDPMRVMNEAGCAANNWTVKKTFSVPKTPIVVKSVVVK